MTTSIPTAGRRKLSVPLSHTCPLNRTSPNEEVVYGVQGLIRRRREVDGEMEHDGAFGEGVGWASKR